MANQRSYKSGDFRSRKRLHEDLHYGGLRRSYRRELSELKEFMLTAERRERLERMGRLKRLFVIPWWLLKSLLQKLTPFRRLMVVVGLWLSFTNISGSNRDQSRPVIGIAILLLVLILELKDKLLAREELEAGHAVQKALMPPTSPQVPGWSLWLFTRSANEVGGDLLDFISIDEDRFGVAVGDVAGKGLRAALLTAKLQALLRALALDCTSLGALVAKLNQIFCRDKLPQMFSTLIYLELQANSRRIRVVNAGHYPPVLIRSDRIEKMAKGGLALSLSDRAIYNEVQVELAPTEWLLVYSDGLTEAQNEQQEFFGEERLLELLPQLTPLPVEQIGQKLVETVDRFIGDARVNDDLSIALVMKA